MFYLRVILKFKHMFKQMTALQYLFILYYYSNMFLFICKYVHILYEFISYKHNVLVVKWKTERC